MILDRLRSIIEGEGEEPEEPEVGPNVIVVASPELIEPSMVPQRVFDKIWGVLEKDLPLTFLDERDLRWLQYRVEVIASVASLIEPEIPHPEVYRILRKGLQEWVDEENVKLLAFVRMKRAYKGMERRLQTIQAPRFAVRGW